MWLFINTRTIAVMVKILISELLFFDYLELIPFKHSDGVYVASPDAITNEIKLMCPNCSFKT